MKGFLSLLILAAAAAFVTGSGLVADELTPTVWQGVFVRMDDNKLLMTMKVAEQEAKEVSVFTTDRTTVTLDGKDARIKDLKEGYLLRVSLIARKLGEAATADTIEAKTPPPVK